MSPHRSSPLLLVLLAACADSATEPASPESPAAPPVLASVVSNGRVPIDLVVQKCGGPAVAVSGWRHETFRLTFDESGGLHRGYHLNLHLQGQADDGTRYMYSGVQNSQIYFANPPFTDVTELHLRLLAQGSGEDFIQVFRYHQTINANGEITTSFTAASEECGQGGSGGTVAGFLPTLLTPPSGAEIPQNDPALPCPYDPARGRGIGIAFDWTDAEHPGGIAGYEVHVQREGSTSPLIHTTVATSGLDYLSCDGFVVDPNLEGWSWRVRALAGSGETGPWTEPSPFRFAPCRLDDGTPCHG